MLNALVMPIIQKNVNSTSNHSWKKMISILMPDFIRTTVAIICPRNFTFGESTPKSSIRPRRTIIVPLKSNPNTSLLKLNVMASERRKDIYIARPPK